jgi:integrase
MPYKRGRKWVGEVRRDKERKQKLFPSKKEAIAWETEMSKKSEEAWKKEINTRSLGDWALKYLKYSEGKFSTKTFKEKCHVFKLFFKSIDPVLPVEQLKPGDILDHIILQKNSRSGNSANKDRKNLVAAWNWGMKYLIPPLPGPNPFLVEKMAEIRHPRYVPPEEDFWKVYDVAEGQDQVMLLTLLYLAIRRGEAFRLTWADVDFGNSQIRIWTRKRKDGSLECDWLPMTKELRSALRWWWENRPIKDSEFVFVCLNEHPGQAQNFGKPFVTHPKLMKRLCEKAGVKPFGFHAIRHLTSTILYKLGYAVKDIQPILRHKSPRTTEIYLGKLGLNSLRTTLESLPKYSGKADVIYLKNKAEE